MKGPRKTINMKLHHLYDFSELYQAIYNRNEGYKMQEANAFAHIAFQMHPRATSLLELLSGAHSKHADYFKKAWPAQGLKYSGTDGTLSAGNPSIIQVRDITQHIFKQQWDIVTAHYYSPSSVCDMDKGGIVTRAGVQGFINAAFSATKKGGIFIMDFCSDGYATAISPDERMSGKPSTQEFHVDCYTPLYRWLVSKNLASNTRYSSVVVVARVTSYYDRTTSNNVDEFSSISIKVDGRVVVSVKIKNPFCQRYFSEPELTDMMHDAGFAQVDAWHCDYDANDFENLDPVLTWDADETDDEDLLESIKANVLVGIRK